MIKNIMDKPITIMWGCSQRTIFPDEVIDVNKEFDCEIEKRFIDKYIGQLVKYTETFATFSNQVATSTLTNPDTKVVTKKKGRPKKRKL